MRGESSVDDGWEGGCLSALNRDSMIFEAMISVCRKASTKLRTKGMVAGGSTKHSSHGSEHSPLLR